MREQQPYQEVFFETTRYSMVIIIGVLFCELIFAALLYNNPESVFVWILTALFFVVFLLFYRLDIVLDHEFLSISKGIGLISEDIPLALVQTVTIASNSSMLNWIYDPLSAESLSVELRDGAVFTIAIPERRRLQELLRIKIDR